MDRLKPAIASPASFFRMIWQSCTQGVCLLRCHFDRSNASRPGHAVSKRYARGLFYSSTSSAELGDTRNNADGTSSSECELRRDVRTGCACARPQRLPLVVERYRRQPLHVARPRSAAEYPCDRNPVRPSPITKATRSPRCRARQVTRRQPSPHFRTRSRREPLPAERSLGPNLEPPRRPLLRQAPYLQLQWPS